MEHPPSSHMSIEFLYMNPDTLYFPVYSLGSKVTGFLAACIKFPGFKLQTLFAYTQSL